MYHDIPDNVATGFPAYSENKCWRDHTWAETGFRISYCVYCDTKGYWQWRLGKYTETREIQHLETDRETK